ncbi:MAG: hypothetical protein LUG16_03185 [Candidatus Gastranaerophilales bacterium]|nr:hypothetical protein [Candidatus Gastranaerophilales bacterium]
MLNSLYIFILAAVFWYTVIFTVYFSLIVAASCIKPKNKNYKIKRAYKNLIVIIYSHNNEKTIVNLLEQLNKQDYPKGNYQTHIILDNCTDNSSNKLEFVGGAKLWRLTDDTPLGKDKSVSWLLENLMSFKKVDAYVFLNANRIVKSDFLSSINEAIQENQVVVGSTDIYLEDADFVEKVFSNINDYNSNVMRLGRSRLGLAIPIDSDITVLTHEVLEKIQCIDFKDANSELKYSFLLTSVNYPPKFIPEIKTYVSSIDYTIKRPEFLFKMSLFLHCLNLRAISNFKFLEFLLSLFKPNPVILLGMLVLVGTYSFNYYFLYDFPWSVFLACVLTVAFVLSVYKSNLYWKPLVYLISGPFCTLCSSIGEITFIKKLVKLEKKQKNADIEKITVPVFVTNGRNIFPCTMDLISENGFKKAVFRYKNKKQETNQGYVRMCDAVKNISDILEQHGFRMKICQSCAYFSPKIDGTNNMVKGYCNKKAVDDENCSELPETLLWSSCEYYIPEEVNKVIDISDYIKNR